MIVSMVVRICNKRHRLVLLWKLGMTANSATIFILSGSFDSNHFFYFIYNRPNRLNVFCEDSGKGLYLNSLFTLF